MLPILNPQSAIRDEESPGAFAALGAVLLAAALVFGVMWAWTQPSGVGLYNLGRAESLLAESRYTEALALLEGTLRYYPSHQTRLFLSEAYLGLRDAERAERQARTALAASRPHERARAWTQLGRALAQKGEVGGSLEAWERARESGEPYAADPLVARHVQAATWRTAIYHWQRGDTGAALPYLVSLAGGHDSYAHAARLHLAQLYAPTDPQLSLDYLKTSPSPRSSLLPRTPRSDAVPSNTEVSRLSLALHKAHEEAEKIRQERGGDGAALATLWGTAYLQQGEYILARQQLERAVSLDPNAAGAHTRLSLALAALGELEGAIAHLQTAKGLAPEDPLTRRALAGIHMSRKEWALADAELDAISKLQPASVGPHLARAEYHSLRGEYDDAEREYEQAVGIERGGPGGEGEPEAALAAARFYIDTRGKICERGLPHAQTALQRQPDSPVALDLVGWGLVICGDPAGGLNALEQAVHSAPLSPRYRYHLARAYADLGRPREALHQLTRVTDLDPGGPWSRLATAERVKIEANR